MERSVRRQPKKRGEDPIGGNVTSLSTPQPIPYHQLLDHQHHEAFQQNIARVSFCRAASWIYSFIQIITWRLVAFTGSGDLGGCAYQNLAFFAQTQVFGLRGFNRQVPGVGTEIMLCFCFFCSLFTTAPEAGSVVGGMVPPHDSTHSATVLLRNETEGDTEWIYTFLAHDRILDFSHSTWNRADGFGIGIG